MKLINEFDPFFKKLMDDKDDSMVDSIIWRVQIKNMPFEKAVDDTLKKNRKNLDPNRRKSIISKAKKELNILDEAIKHSVKIDKVINIIKKAYIEKYCKLIWDQKGDLYQNYDSTLTFNEFVTDKIKSIYISEDHESAYDINLEVLRQDKIIENDFINFLKKINFNKYGWHLTSAFKTNILSVFRLRLEKLHGEKIKVGRFIYHITFDIYMNKINELGIIPLNNSKLVNHPKRIYCLTKKDQWENLASQLFIYEKNKKSITAAVLLKIDLQKLKHGVKFYHDPDCGFEGGIYTYSIIPKNAFKIDENENRINNLS